MKKVKLKLLIPLIILGIFLAGCGTNEEGATLAKEENQYNQTTQTKDEDTVELNNTRYYFTANEGGSISKIDAATNKVVETIEVDGIVHNVQVSPDGKTVGATVVPAMMHHDGDHGSMKMTGKAVFFDTNTNELLKSVEVGNHPAHIVFTENGEYALVTNNEDNNVSVIDTESFTVAQTVNTGKGPHGFRISTDSGKAYIANMGEDTVSVLDLQTMEEEKRITVGSAPVTTGVTSDGKILVATINAENMLAIVDLATGQVKKVPVGNGPAQGYIDANNQFAYVANQGTKDSPSNSVSVVDLAAKKVAATIETGKGSHGVVTSSDGKRAYVTNMYENTVSVIDTEENKVIETIEVGETPNGITIMK